MAVGLGVRKLWDHSQFSPGLMIGIRCPVQRATCKKGAWRSWTTSHQGIKGLEKELGMTPRGMGRWGAAPLSPRTQAAPEGNQPQQLVEGMGRGQEELAESES